MILILILLLRLTMINGFLDNYYFLQGKWVLRSTNDKSLQNKYTYLILNPNNELKLKTISNGFIKTKISRTGTIIFTKNNNSFLKNNYFNSLKNLQVDNDIDCDVIINNINVYSYSIIGLEIPQIRYKQITDYNLKKKINIKQKKTSIYITDNDNDMYYLFDLNTQVYKTPYVEISLTTIIINELFDLFFSMFIKN